MAKKPLTEKIRSSFFKMFTQTEKKSWIFSLGFLAVTVILMINYRNVFAAETAKDAFGLLSDCFFAPGVLIAGFAGLTFVASKGMFDSFSFFFSNYAFQWARSKDISYRPQSYYDFKAEKDEKGRGWKPYLLFIGVMSLLVSMIFLVIYLVL